MYHVIRIDDGNCPAFALTLPVEKGPAAAWYASLTEITDIALLALDYLEGAGTMIDVGANIGVVTVPVAAAGSNVVAVELLPENALYLTLSVLHNRLSNVRLYQLAAAAERGLAQWSGSEAWGHVVRPGESGAPAVKLPLDDVVALAQLAEPGFVRRPVFLKIDTEGYELDVLRGARRLIDAFEPAILVESIMVEGRASAIEERAVTVKRLLEEAGYTLYLLRAGRLVPRRAAEPQEGHVADYFATLRRYKTGERIGRFTVGPLEFADSLGWLEEMAGFPVFWHRMHAAGVAARWLAEGCIDPRLDALRDRLLTDAEPTVCEFARRVFGDG